ncbi:MAG: glutaredoxin family protein [Gammaproteobacteria bacterium]|nr:glutaredoxin family protein [Gammaproteobacteria bacterium]
MHLILYSTDHCTVCEQALDLLLSMPELQGFSLGVIDIALEPVLVERYGERVPVLSAGDSELDWPFDAKTVAETIASES